MYQYYYSDIKNENPIIKQSVNDVFCVKKIRATMWEEHCLECAAPLCYKTCLNYVARQDGRCKLFKDSISQSRNEKGVLGKSARVSFRKWGNLLSIVYPKMLTADEYKDLDNFADKTSQSLYKTVRGHLPVSLKWKKIRVKEYLRRKQLKKGIDEKSDAFILHCYNHGDKPFTLFLEIFDNNHNSLFKYGFKIKEGENLFVLSSEKYNESCDKSGNLIKIYPENNYEADVTFLWCDFVQGTPVVASKPADKVKCVVWDLDNTLWDGILIEHDGDKPLVLKNGVLSLIKALDERGIIQSVASKNDFEPAFEMLKKIGIDEYFIYPQINWGAKSDSLVTIAKNLNINLDTFAFIDDSEFERRQVESVLPSVRTYKDTDITALINEKPFDVIVTDDSKNRRKMYKAEEKRNAVRVNSNSNVEDFIKQCKLEIKLFEPSTEEEKLRCYELVLRTNQLNMSGVKYSEKEFSDVLAKENVRTYAFSCKDIFGEYGIVGFLQYSIEDKQIVFKEFAMSCRVAGKYIESALFSYLLCQEDAEKGVFEVNITAKNTLLRSTLENIGFVTANNTNKSIEYNFTGQLKNNDLVKICFR